MDLWCLAKTRMFSNPYDVMIQWLRVSWFRESEQSSDVEEGKMAASQQHLEWMHPAVTIIPLPFNLLSKGVIPVIFTACMSWDKDTARKTGHGAQGCPRWWAGQLELLGNLNVTSVFKPMCPPFAAGTLYSGHQRDLR